MTNSRQSMIYFTSLELESVRCFGRSQILDLTDGSGNPARWTLLLGDNGVGKTTLLQCLSWMRPVPVQRSGYEGPKSLKQGPLGPALPEEENSVLEALLRSGNAVQLAMSAELSFNNALTSHNGAKRRSSRTKAKRINTHIELFYTKRKELEDYERTGTSIKALGSFVEPLIVTYGASRHMGRQNLDLTNLIDPIAARLGGLTELYDAEEILLRLDHAAAKKGYKPRGAENRRLEKVKEILANVLPDDLKAADIKILGPKIEGFSTPSGVRFKTFSGLVALSALSLGYQTTLAWTTDLAWRLFRNYPSSRNPLAEPAIVLIDEIDLHLHPLWQRTIMDHLSLVFPSTQFIATAHSPLMVQSAPNANLAVLRKTKNEVLIENDPEVVGSWRVDQILNSELFDVPNSRDAKTEALFTERAKLLDKIQRDPSDEVRLRRLEKQLAELPTASDKEDQMAIDFIRKAATLLKRTRAVRS
jgi:energy-coupling factor transporter ATP-binding protein EcfA2